MRLGPGPAGSRVTPPARAAGRQTGRGVTGGHGRAGRKRGGSGLFTRKRRLSARAARGGRAPPGMEPGAEHQQQLRSLRDFLLVYNRMTELCFRHCVSNLNYRLLTGREESCLDSCAAKLVHANHRLMSAYVALMPSIMQRRASDYEASAAQASQSSAQAGSAAPAALPAAGGPGASPDPPAAPDPAGALQGAAGAGT
ncbi:mitochondrial import inner membrane translocase subunit Tim10 B [Theristicus caerulescens]